MKQQIQKLARFAGYDIRQRQPNLVDFLQSRKINLVLDVGANVGQFATQLRRWGYAGRIMSFEPVSELFRLLLHAAAGDDLWSVHRIAVGASSGQAKINISNNPLMSSMAEQVDLAYRSQYQMQTIRIDEVQITRLDDLATQLANARVFLKIDTQGFEPQVLEGAKSTLSSFLGVLLELPLANLYKTWSFREAIDYMDKAGFVPAQFHPVSFLFEDAPSLLEVDCLFRRRV
jgi:FkbM family methyltransferase